MTMKLIFICPFMNPHIEPICHEFHELYGNEFEVLEYGSFEKKRESLGWTSCQLPYMFRYADHYDDVINADYVIYGGLIDSVIRKRIYLDKITFLMTERPYKIPTTYKNYFRRLIGSELHFGRYQGHRTYVLCLGSHVAEDMLSFGNFKDHMFIWGYFPQFISSSDSELHRNNSKPRLLWAGRMIELKHPEIMLSIKKQLDSRNIPSTIQMIGDGPLFEHLQKQSSIEHLNISFDGAHPFEYVRKNMSLADIFVFSSDRNEGWGAVLNEAMNAGCAPIANRCVGSSELLIRDGFSGILCDSQEEMARVTVELASAPDKYQLYGKNAYVSIRDIWNAHEAVLRFVNTIEHDCSFQYQSGPMSNAELSSKKISNNCE